VEYLKSQLSRTQIVAPIDGIVLVDDASEWIGKPVVTGERIMTIADEQQVEVEAWLSPEDLINFPNESNVKLFLNASPLHPVQAKLRYISYEAVARPDGQFAYRLRATISDHKVASRVGLKGTARVAGGYVPLGYWVMRRPLAFIRPYIEV
jgi:multidrug resistance efflux pump